MNENIRIKNNSQLAKSSMKIIADQKVINAHIAKSNHLFDLKEKADLIDSFTAFREIRKMAENGQLPDLTLDEINEEIKLSRINRHTI